jgi:hypothetical protein
VTEPEVEAVARAVRRAKFESLGKMSSFDPTIAPTEGELADARAAIAHLRAAEAAAFRRGWLAGRLAATLAIAVLPLPEDKP